jgi:hypothetical protein
VLKYLSKTKYIQGIKHKISLCVREREREREKERKKERKKEKEKELCKIGCPH